MIVSTDNSTLVERASEWIAEEFKPCVGCNRRHVNLDADDLAAFARTERARFARELADYLMTIEPFSDAADRPDQLRARAGVADWLRAAADREEHGE